MKKFTNVLLVIFCFVSSVLVATADYYSPLTLTPGKDNLALFVAEATAHKIDVLDLKTKKIVRSLNLPFNPSGVTFDKDFADLFVTGGSHAGRVCVINRLSGKTRSMISVGHTPMAPVVSLDGKKLFVCNRYDNNVSIIDLVAEKEISKIFVAREPIGAVLSPDGKYLFVANHLPAGRADGDYIAASVSVIDLEANKLCATIELPNGATGLRGLCMSPDGKHIFVTHILARYQVPTTQIERGWINTNAITIIDVAKKKYVNTFLLDDVNEGAANPWGVICTPDNKYLCVAHAGTHELSVIDKAKMFAKLADADPDNVPNDLSFLVGIRKRINLDGKGPRGLAVVGTTVYAAEYFSDSISMIDVNHETAANPESVKVGPQHEPDEIRQGEIFFNDASLCFQRWQSCASCHPDGRTDALNWDLLNDGLGNPKQTKNMLNAHATPPVMITGVRPNAEYAVRAGIRFIQFAVRPEEDAEKLDAYIKSLTPVSSPFLLDGKHLSESAKRGEKIFEKAKCVSCHTAPLYTDLKKHDLGMGENLDEGVPFDTPALVECWRTAPYMFDGRSATIKDVLTTDNKGDKHGVTSSLADHEINDLIEYIMSL